MQLNTTDYENAPKLIKAYIFDLDGTLRRTKSGKTFPINADDVELYPDVAVALRKLDTGDSRVFIVTNQGGVAFGICSPQEGLADLEHTLNLFDDSPISQLIACFHHPNGKIYPYNKRSLLRKPYYGMLVKLELDAANNGYVIDWDHSLMVGDRAEDQHCANGAEIDFAWAWDFFEREPTDEQYNTLVLGLKEFRKDGWPLCPVCGEDELWTPVDTHEGSHPSKQAGIQHGINSGMSCYACQFYFQPRKKKSTPAE